MSTWTEKSQAIPVIQAGVSDRMAFIKKVYSLLGLSLLTGILASVFTLSNVGFLDTVNQNYWFFVIAGSNLRFCSSFYRSSIDCKKIKRKNTHFI